MKNINLNKFSIDPISLKTKICDYLEIKQPKLHSNTAVEIVKELCVAKLCLAIGLTGKYNYKSDFFTFFSEIMGEAVCCKLSINLRIARDEIRLIKYEGVNLVEQAKNLLENELIEESVLDIFEMADKYKQIVKIK